MDFLSILGIVTGILNILQALYSANDLAKSCWGAPDELQELASELSKLKTLARNVETPIKERVLITIDLRDLQTAYSTLQDAQKMFEERLSNRHKPGDAESRFRQKTWIFYRGRIRKLTKTVTIVRNDFKYNN